MLKYVLFSATLLTLLPRSLYAQPDRWKPVATAPDNIGTRHIVPDKAVLYSLEFNDLKNTLRQAPAENTGRGMNLEIPTPDGGSETFEIWRYDMMEAGLATQFPEIGTYLGRSTEVPSRTIRIDHTYQGFHAMVQGVGGSWFVDPLSPGNTRYYQVYYKHDLRNTKPFNCEVGELIEPEEDFTQKNILPNGTQLKTYRIAITASGEYTAFHGGTVAGAQSAQVTTMNRVNGIYEKDFSVRMIIIANNNLIIYTSAATDGITNGSPDNMIDENQNIIDNVIGSANYDIGHVFGTNSGGLAGLGVVCSSSRKANGVTGSSAPVGDPFDIDYVAHEVGHQFGASHTFNSSAGSCGGGNRSGNNAYEPGSGVTVMAYAGICGVDNIASNSIDNFHARSYESIRAFITSGGGNSCAVTTPINNSIPVVDAGPSIYRIPLRTPFRLKATGSDANAGDQLTYSWEEYDLGNSVPLAQNPTSGTHPLFRCYSPDTSATRIFPRMQTIVNNQTDTKEKLPYYARRLRFRVAVRDNRPNGGAVSLDSTTIWATANTGPFAVTSPNAFLTWPSGSSQTVTWSTAGSNQAPINCQNVNIKLSTDGGYTYPITLLANTPNDGSQTITVPTLPNSPVTTCRVMVEAVGNIFFDISNANFTIQSGPVLQPVAAFAVSSQGPYCSGGRVSFVDRSDNGPSEWAWTFEGGNPSTSTDQNPTNILFATPGTYTITLQATNVSGSNTTTQTFIVYETPRSTFAVTAPTPGQSNGTITASPTGGTAPYLVQWSTLPPQTGLTATNLNLGQYDVYVTDANGCAAAYNVQVTANASLTENDALGVGLFPNPAEETITLTLKTDGEYRYVCYDAAGRTVLQGNFTGNTQTFSLTSLSSGLYTFRVSDGKSTVNKKVFKR